MMCRRAETCAQLGTIPTTRRSGRFPDGRRRCGGDEWIFAVTGKRIRTLPIDPKLLKIPDATR